MLQIREWDLGLTSGILGCDTLPTLVPAWDDLCRRSLEDNVYYSPKYARALLANVNHDEMVRFAVVWSHNTLIALLPFTTPRFRVPVLGPAARAWRSKYTFSCMPLLDRDRKIEAANALLNLLRSVQPGEWTFSTLNSEGEVCRALIDVLDRRARPWTLVNRFQRASLELGPSFDEHMKQHVSAKRRRDLARNRRRLEQLGRVEYRAYSCGAGLARALEAFLEIETNGWKGRKGTALGCNEAGRKFAVAAFTGQEHDSICRADLLTLDETPIAVSLTVFADRTGFTVKCAYDEAYRSYSAGLLLEIEVVRSFLSDKWADRLDASTAGPHTIDSLWSGRIEVADLMFSLAAENGQIRLSLLEKFERTRSSLKSEAKRWLLPRQRSFG
jgi:CelD/BcsL family acetyltransferase involved in cellulose biosynthesis